jgi:hypothetical protein
MGELIWALNSANASTSVISSLATDAHGNIYFTGSMGPGGVVNTTNGTLAGSGSGFVAMVTPEGKSSWIKPIQNGFVYNIFNASDGFLYLTGTLYREFKYQSYRTFGDSGDSFVLKITRGGDFSSILVSEPFDLPTFI